MSTGKLRVEREGAIGYIVLDNLERRNAINAAMWAGIPSAVDGFLADPDVRCIVVRGAGNVAFAAGADISEFEQKRSSEADVKAYENSIDAAHHSIENAGGLARWQAPSRAESREQNYVPELWRWLQALTTKGEPGPELYLGYGREDHLAKSGALLAAALPQDRVYTREGGHKWTIWRQLFRDFLAQGPLKTRCPPH